MGGSPNTNPTGQHSRSCWPRQANRPTPATPTKSQSVRGGTPPLAASCSRVNRRWGVAQTQNARTKLGPARAGIACGGLDQRHILTLKTTSRIEFAGASGSLLSTATLYFDKRGWRWAGRSKKPGLVLPHNLDESLD